MSIYFKIHGEREVKKYKDGRTKQSFKDETDINRILAKFQTSGVISHKAKFEPEYGDFNDFDFAENIAMLQRGGDIFAALPSEVRREFDQNPADFFRFVNDPANEGKLSELLPKIAETGDYFIDVDSKTPPGELLGGGEPGGRRSNDRKKEVDNETTTVPND